MCAMSSSIPNNANIYKIAASSSRLFPDHSLTFGQVPDDFSGFFQTTCLSFGINYNTRAMQQHNTRNNTYKITILL